MAQMTFQQNNDLLRIKSLRKEVELTYIPAGVENSPHLRGQLRELVVFAERLVQAAEKLYEDLSDD